MIVERVPCAQIPELDDYKLLVPDNLSLIQLILIIRKRLKWPFQKKLYLLIKETIIEQSITEMGLIYINFKGNN